MTTMPEPASPILNVEDYIALPAVPADHRLFYGTGPEQFGDLYLPERAGPHPVAIVVHGGCWHAQFGLERLGLLCQALKLEGLAVWSLEYRRLGLEGGWPTTFADISAGADFLRGLADRCALDLSRMVTVGHSAGGHLALWLAARHRLPAASQLFVVDPLPVHGVVCLAGIPDLAESIRRDICGGAAQELLGGLPAEMPDRYQQGSPIALLPLGVPQWHLVGLLDAFVPADYVQQYVAVAQQQDEVHLDVFPEVGHIELVVPTTPVWAAVRQAVLTLLQRA